jgi:uncharacterized coiled-coil protein SlyX
MLKTIIENLTMRIEELEAKYEYHGGVMDNLAGVIVDMSLQIEQLNSRLDKLHVVSEQPIGILKPGRSKISHTIGKLTKGNKNG